VPFPGALVVTLEELGATFGVSRERIRQIEVRALQKIKGALRARLDQRDRPVLSACACERPET
jgi:RNA polymerase sigma-32 factor